MICRNHQNECIAAVMPVMKIDHQHMDAVTVAEILLPGGEKRRRGFLVLALLLYADQNT